MFEYLWNLKVMPSAQFYVWRALSDRIATKQNFHKRGATLGGYIMCIMREGGGVHFTHSCFIRYLFNQVCSSFEESKPFEV